MSLQESEPSLRSPYSVFIKVGIGSLQKQEFRVLKSWNRVYKSPNYEFTRVRAEMTKVGILSLKQDSEKKSEL